MVRIQNTPFSALSSGVPATKTAMSTTDRQPSWSVISRGDRMCTKKVCRYPLYQRLRCRIQLMGSGLASSRVVESSTLT